MTSNTPTSPRPVQPTHEPEPAGAAEPSDDADSPDVFQTALETEVARRIEAVERRWQSRKDRELNRARRRWESEAGQAIDPDLLAWIAQADPRDVGQWLKSGLTEGQPAAQDAASGRTAEPPTPDAAPDGQSAPDAPQPTGSAETGQPGAEPGPAAESGDPATPTPGSDGAAAKSAAADAAATAAAGLPNDAPADAGEPGAEPPPPDLEREAQARERLAERRSRDPAPDLFPSRGAPADAFQQIEAGFARGEVDLDTYETARRRRGLT